MDGTHPQDPQHSEGPKPAWDDVDVVLEEGEHADGREPRAQHIAHAVRTGITFTGERPSSEADVFDGIAARVRESQHEFSAAHSTASGQLPDSVAARRVEGGRSMFGRGTVMQQMASSRTTWMSRLRAVPAFGAWLGVLVVALGWMSVHKYWPGQPTVPATTYSTANGQRANVTLADGSSVLLNVGSRLVVPAGFGTTTRALSLTGEALLTVVRHDGLPLTVQTGGTTARVLGTTFLVRRYATDSVTTVAVREGKVAVQSAVVPAHYQVDVASNGRSIIRPLRTEEFTFATGTLTLDWMPVHEAVPALSRWYDVTIVLADSALARRPMKGAFAAGTAADLAAILRYTLRARVEVDGRTLTIFPQ